MPSDLYDTSPHDFFEKAILQSTRAQRWLQERLTVANDLSSRLKSAVKPTPNIWLLTGVYLMSNTSQQIVTTNTRSQNTALQIPVPDPSGMSTLLQLNVGGSASTASDVSFGTSVEIKEEKVWAAQWQKVKVKKVKIDKWEDALQNHIRLLETFSLATVREGRKIVEECEVAQLDLDDSEQEVENADGHMDADDWKDFDEEVEELVAGIEETEKNKDNK